MHGKTVVITGATSGIGEVAACRLASMGARIVFVARNQDRAAATLAKLKQIAPAVEHRAHYGDLARLSESKRVAADIAASEPRIDVLMNNAGAMFHKRFETEDRLEKTFALNHMSYFIVTQILRERLLATPGARIVNTASDAHRNGAIDFKDLQFANSYGSFKAYCRSKLCNILFTRELARRLEGTGVVANSLHPGFVATRLGDEGNGLLATGFRLAKKLALTPEQGARTMIFLASAPEAAGFSGEYFDKCAPKAPTQAAQDDEAATKLWAESVRISGLAN
jgi:NAD(P)-dependent dehydrogenase (short-subunit alcohol dehydrogenase family)